MLQDREVAEVQEKYGARKNSSIIVILICAFISVFLQNSGFLSLFFLVPVGYAIIVSGYALLTICITAGIKIIASLFLSRYFQVHDFIVIEFAYFSVMLIGFTWIIDGKTSQIKTSYRFLSASAAAAFVFLILFFGSSNNTRFAYLLNEQIDIIYSIIISSAGNDAVRLNYLQQALTPESILETFKSILLRGGALLTMLFLFFTSRQITIAAVWVIKKRREGSGLNTYFAPPNTIWVLSCSLALILLSRLFRIEIPEIAAWNVFVLCAIIFLAQGAGIILHFLQQRSVSFRFVANILIIIAIISPGINTAALAAVFLLGIAENWFSFRVKEASTPRS